MATESSVVVALREVRRLELERQRREEEARQVALEEERARHAQQGSIQYHGMEGMGPYGNGNGNGHANGWANGHPNGDMHPESYAHPHPMRRTSEVVPLAANGYGDQSQPYVHVPGAVWESPAQQPKPRSSFKAVVATMIVCGGAAFAGYMKLNADHAKALSQQQTEYQKISDARAETIASRSKTEQELKLKVTELEGKLAAAQAKAASAATALAAVTGAKPAAAADAPRVALGGKGRGLGAWKGRNARLAAAKAARAAAAAPKLEAAAPAAKAPRLVKKKAVTDDPLGGLKL
jgi:hypothetical protein